MWANQMKRKLALLKPLLAIAVFVTLVITFYSLIGQDKTELPSPLIDRPAPNFQVLDLLDKNIVHTQDEFMGRITMVNVWASWCPTCYTEHPYWREYAKNTDLTLVGLNYRDKENAALGFLSKLGNPYQWNLFDNNGRLGIEFGVYGAPETYLIDRKGKVRYRHVGMVSPDVYENIFLPLVEKIKKGF